MENNTDNKRDMSMNEFRYVVTTMTVATIAVVVAKTVTESLVNRWLGVRQFAPIEITK